MARSVLQGAGGSAAQHRRLALAIVVSVLLHAPLLLPPGTFSLGTLGEAPRATAELEVRYEPPAADEPDGVQIAETTRPDVEPPIEPIAVPLDAVTASFRIADVEPLETEAPAEEVPLEETPLEEMRLGATRVAEAQLPDGAAGGPDEPAGEAPVTAAAETGPQSVVDAVTTVAPSEYTAVADRVLQEARGLLASGGAQSRLTFEHQARAYTAVLTRRPAENGTDVERVTVEIATGENGERVRTRLQMKRLAFSHFTQLVDRWDPWVQLHDDEIAGRFHSNTEIVLTYSRRIAPRLLGPVSTAQGVRFNDVSGRRRHGEIFMGGLQTRTPRVKLPAIALPVATERAMRGAEVHVVRADARIAFRSDGSYEWRELASGARGQRRLPAGTAVYIVGANRAVLHVRGTVDGSVTVYSPARIVIEGTLRYAADPRADGGSDDFLGLVSDRNIEIAAPRVTGRGDLEVQAALYARRRFVVIDADPAAHSSMRIAMLDTPRRSSDTLLIYGSLTAGSISETEPRYATRIEFDSRFEHVRPPGFPQTDRYEIEAWDGRWRTAELD